jgi:hypothetical protein
LVAFSLVTAFVGAGSDQEKTGEQHRESPNKVLDSHNGTDLLIN